MVDHPFSDARGSKVRPMLIVQSDVRNRLLNHTVVAMVSGLSATSAVRCGNLFTLHEQFILRKVGALSAVLMQQVNDGLRTALELP